MWWLALILAILGGPDETTDTTPPLPPATIPPPRVGRHPLPQETRCPHCIARGHTSELLMSAAAVYCPCCGWAMAVSIDLPVCGKCHEAPAAVLFNRQALCVPCRVFLVR